MHLHLKYFNLDSRGHVEYLYSFVSMCPLMVRNICFNNNAINNNAICQNSGWIPGEVRFSADRRRVFRPENRQVIICGNIEINRIIHRVKTSVSSLAAADGFVSFFEVHIPDTIDFHHLLIPECYGFLKTRFVIFPELSLVSGLGYVK